MKIFCDSAVTKDHLNELSATTEARLKELEDDIFFNRMSILVLAIFTVLIALIAIIPTVLH